MAAELATYKHGISTLLDGANLALDAGVRRCALRCIGYICAHDDALLAQVMRYCESVILTLVAGIKDDDMYVRENACAVLVVLLKKKDKALEDEIVRHEWHLILAEALTAAEGHAVFAPVMALAEITKIEVVADQVCEDMNETVTSALQMVLNNTLFEHTAVAAAKTIENLGSVDADSLCLKGIIADVLYRHMIARTQGLKDACADAFR